MIVRVVDSIPLQGAGVVGVTELSTQPLEDRPIVSLAVAPDFMFEIPAKIGGHSIIVE